jgi:hypothetical protein
VTPDVFALIGGKVIYQVDFSAAPTPSSALIQINTEAGTLNGLAVLNTDTVPQ